MAAAKYTPKDSSRFWSGVQKTTLFDCWEWTQGRYKDGYGGIIINRKTRRVHRVAWELTNGDIPSGMIVCHACDNPICCNPAHLFLGTTLDNIRDKVDKGRQSSGEQHGRHKLTLEQVRYIRQRYAAGGIFQREIAAEMGVSQTAIGLIVRRIIWRE